MPRFDLSHVADRMLETLAQTEEALRLEQAVRGLDALPETALQGLLSRGLAAHYEVAREVCYPSGASARRSHRQRCDLVLTDKGSPLLPGQGQLALFDGAGAAGPVPSRSPSLVGTKRSGPEEALWLEMKVASQFREGGLRRGTYGGQFRRGAVQDLRKMAAEAPIREGGFLLVVFNESREILEKDLLLFEALLEQGELLCGFRQQRSLPIQERIGHHLCTVVLWPTLWRGGP